MRHQNCTVVLCMHAIYAAWSSTVQLHSMLQGSTLMEQHLADVCNSIIVNGSVCQAFDYNTVSKIAYFKGQPPTMQIDYTTAACTFPNVTLWVLSSGKHQVTWAESAHYSYVAALYSPCTCVSARLSSLASISSSHTTPCFCL